MTEYSRAQGQLKKAGIPRTEDSVRAQVKKNRFEERAWKAEVARDLGPGKGEN